MRFLKLLFIGLCLANIAFAETIQNISDKTVSPNDSQIKSVVIGNANDWHLSNPEWQHYLELMMSTSGKWYRQLTPAEVLGINARTPEEREHFAEIVAHQEHDKIERELAFDHAFHLAMQKIYGEEPIINSFDISPFTPVLSNASTVHLLSGDHVALFVDIQQSNFEISRLIHLIQTTPNTQLDLYCVSASNQDIQQWAKTSHLPVDLVNNDRITLNKESGQLQKIAPSAKLPYAVLVRDDKSIPLSLNSLQ